MTLFIIAYIVGNVLGIVVALLITTHKPYPDRDVMTFPYVSPYSLINLSSPDILPKIYNNG